MFTGSVSLLSKPAILRQILEALNEQLTTLAGASRAMHADASDEQNKAEDKYDTRGLESAYLASSQARLATETEQAIALYQSLELRKFTPATPIDLTALIDLDATLYFLGPMSGGLEVRLKGQEVVVITPESPLGQQLMGKKTGDRVKLPTGREFRINSVS